MKCEYVLACVGALGNGDFSPANSCNFVKYCSEALRANLENNQYQKITNNKTKRQSHRPPNR